MTNKKHVIKLQAPFERIKLAEVSPDFYLRMAIIRQAMNDATHIGENGKLSKIAEEARMWIFDKDDSFLRMCMDLGIEPDYVLKITRQNIENHMNAIFGIHHNYVIYYGRVEEEERLKLAS